MCGRYSLFTPAEELRDRFDAEPARRLKPRYNCAPGQELPVVTNDAPEEMRFLKWGLVPGWADDRSAKDGLINARAETVDEKPSFREAFERRRCLVPADGFYEWAAPDGEKRPYRVAFEDDRPFAMAGLWERWRPERTQTGLGDFADGGAADADPDVLETFTVVTTDPNEVVAELHDRMAVVLDPDEEETWLHGDSEEAASLLDTHPGDEMRAYPVSARVNNPANDAPDLIEPVEE
ncbi:SOS response-associated peptidase [Halopelagius longus]|uniref:SOS response-associated peptidase n=1 Tax=Halopelagius longus TaxID=1236180 RepID=A0A1H1AGH0_9EURY|nr:SOS response-associated peptidase [Halopelagius longus]RDI70369.1 SOS response-associated peptidase [Halopelagius longus]SDQ38758.1 Putative SOS response-associated peptidase YedK [Halopelagius longus]